VAATALSRAAARNSFSSAVPIVTRTAVSDPKAFQALAEAAKAALAA